MAFVPLRLGEARGFTGDVTTLNWIGPRPGASIEQNLGYAPGRLSQGYWILLLVERLQPGDFNFSGTTLRSGGRVGLPANSDAADRLRPRVHDQILAERGEAGYKALQEQALKSAAYTGPNRIAKVLPITGHDPNLAPSEQYPMGGGGLQWTLKNERKFLVALKVTASKLAEAPGFSVSLAETQPFQQLYNNRVKVARYLETATYP